MKHEIIYHQPGEGASKFKIMVFFSFYELKEIYNMYVDVKNRQLAEGIYHYATDEMLDEIYSVLKSRSKEANQESLFP